VAGLPVTRKNSKTAENQNAEKTRLESRLEELLSNVEGVGEVEVIIMTGDEGNTENFSISSKNEVTGVLVAAQGQSRIFSRQLWHYFRSTLIKLE
jgi:putative heme degradation protein